MLADKASKGQHWKLSVSCAARPTSPASIFQTGRKAVSWRISASKCFTSQPSWIIPKTFSWKRKNCPERIHLKSSGLFFGSFHASWRSCQNTPTTLGRANNSLPNVFEFITYLYETCPSHWDTQGLHHNGQHHRTHTHKHIVTLVAQMHCRHTKTQSQIFSYIIQIHKNAKLTYHYVLMSPAAL